MEAQAATLPTRQLSAGSRAWSWLKRNGIVIYGALALAYMLIPIALIIVFSFNDPAGKFNFTWQGFTLSHWAHPFQISELTDALTLSLRLAALATLISTALGTLIALALVRYDFFGRNAANYLIVIPTATPEVVLGASLLSMFLIYGLSLGFTTLLIAHVMFCISFVVIVVRSRLIGFDRSLEEAAQDLGADPITTFRKITLPLIWPGILAGALLAFALSIDDFVVSNFTAGTEVTFPLYIFGAAQRGIPVQVYIIATMLFAITVLAMIFTVWQQRRAERLASVRPEQEV
jgi:spermidine/putrescine transport system permease protein